METIIMYLRQLDQVVVAVGAVILSAISVYFAIVEAFKNSQLKAAIRLIPTLGELIGKAESNPLGLLSELEHKPVCTPLEASSNLGKNKIVSEALHEMQPKLMKKLGLKDVATISSFITDIGYPLLKPLIKAIKKK